MKGAQALILCCRWKSRLSQACMASEPISDARHLAMLSVHQQAATGQERADIGQMAQTVQAYVMPALGVAGGMCCLTVSTLLRM